MKNTVRNGLASLVIALSMLTGCEDSVKKEDVQNVDLTAKYTLKAVRETPEMFEKIEPWGDSYTGECGVRVTGYDNLTGEKYETSVADVDLWKEYSARE